MIWLTSYVIGIPIAWGVFGGMVDDMEPGESFAAAVLWPVALLIVLGVIIGRVFR